MHFPPEIWKRIFEYDPTYKRIIWANVVDSIPIFLDYQYHW